MPYRPYPPALPSLVVRDPVLDLPPDHLARLVDQVVDEVVQPPLRPPGPGQPRYNPRLCVKVLVYGYATGIRSSRRLEQLCEESLPFLLLTRGDTPSYRTLCTARNEQGAALEQVFVALLALGSQFGMKRLGHLVVDATKLRANASPEAVLDADEFEAVRAELARVLEEAEIVDERESREGERVHLRLGISVPTEQVRDLVRRVRKARKRAPASPAAAQMPPPTVAPEKGGVSGKPAPRVRLTMRMVRGMQSLLLAIEAAIRTGLQHLCLTDPDACMMAEGRAKRVQMCHSWEVAVDRDAALLVLGNTTQVGNDNARLEALVEGAAAHEPEGVVAVDADSGYYAGDAVGRLLKRGLDLCIPDSHTACDLHRGQPIGTQRERHRGKVPFVYDAAQDCYRCPEGNELRRAQKEAVHHGQQTKDYRAVRSCRECPQASECLTQPNAAHRTLKVGQYQDALQAALQRFAEPEFRERYHHRGEAVETVFGFVRGTLGYRSWLLRGAAGVKCEERLLRLAYQVRKVHARWAPTGT